MCSWCSITVLEVPPSLKIEFFMKKIVLLSQEYY